MFGEIAKIEHAVFLVFFMEVVNILSREVAQIFLPSEDAEYITKFAFFIFGIIIPFLLLSIVFFQSTMEQFKVWISWLFMLFNVAAYHYGDNINYIVKRYGGNPWLWGNVNIYLGSILLEFATFCISVTFAKSFKADKRGSALKIILFLTITLESGFSVTTNRIEDEKRCTYIGMTILAETLLSGLVGIFVIIVYCKEKWNSTCTAILSLLSAVLYLLADNLQPLDCLMGYVGSGPEINSGIRIFVAILLIVILALAWCCKYDRMYAYPETGMYTNDNHTNGHGIHVNISNTCSSSTQGSNTETEMHTKHDYTKGYGIYVNGKQIFI